MSIDRQVIRTAARRVAVGAGLLAFGAWLLVLRPQVLGGPAAYITVAGVSMEPALHAGDLVLVTRTDSYEPGDVVAYRVPDGDPAAGRHVIHRVIGGGPEEGYVLQGDNTPAPDRWRPSESDIVGKQILVVPAFGSVLMFLKQPAAIAGLAAAILVFALPNWNATGSGEVARRRKPFAPGSPGAPRASTITVVTSNQAILVDELSAAGGWSAQVLVEFRNVGTEWAEMNAAMSTYTITALDGETTAHGRFTSVWPRRLRPGETGYMLADISRRGPCEADQLVALSTVIACRDARPWARGATQPSPWSLVPG